MRGKEVASDLEQKVLNLGNNLAGWIGENSRLLLLIGALVALLQWAGIIDLSIPWWWPLAAIIVVAAGAAGYVGADKISELIPEEDGILLIAFDASEGKGGEIWEISEDDWADMRVAGTLYEWSESPRRVYECRRYDPEANRAVANWRESKPASELAGPRTVEDALALIRELRQDLEPEAAKAREMRRRLRGIVRQLDRQRAQEMNAVLDERTVDDAFDEATISEILDESLPDDLHPDAGGVDEKTNGHSEQRFRIEQDEFDAILQEDEPIPRGL